MPHRFNRSPGQRFRIEQYIPYLKDAGFEFTYSYIINKTEDKYFYSKGYYLFKTWIVIKGFFKRFYDFFRVFNYDIVFVYREAHMLGTYMFEKLFKITGAKLVFDFDDAIWLNDVSDGNQNLHWLKRPSKTADIARIADLVIAGNEYLAAYAKKYSKNVIVFPTTIDFNYHNYIKSAKNDSRICIGWTGSSTTIKHFENAIPYLINLKKEYGNKVYFKLIVDIEYNVPELNLQSTIWSAENEIEDLVEIDIGIMPLPNDDWSEGKCGFKGLQYMSLGIPTIMSPVGVNKDIINHGENGYLANSSDDWYKYISNLINSKELRIKIGQAGKNSVYEKYSTQNKHKEYVANFLNLIH